MDIDMIWLTTLYFYFINMQGTKVINHVVTDSLLLTRVLCTGLGFLGERGGVRGHRHRARAEIGARASEYHAPISAELMGRVGFPCHFGLGRCDLGTVWSWSPCAAQRPSWLLRSWQACCVHNHPRQERLGLEMGGMPGLDKQRQRRRFLYPLLL